MDVDRVTARLDATRFGDVHWVAETGSTNADLLGLAREGAPEGRVLVTDHQTAGKGRLGRTWQAPPRASLLLSILCRPADPPTSLPTDRMHLVSMALGVAAAEVLRAASGAGIGLKWPNDLVVDTSGGSRKLSGILAESIVEEGRVAALVVGIGINVNWPRDVPEDLREIAIAANHVAGHDLDRDDLLVGLLQHFDRRYASLATEAGGDALRTDYRTLSATLGRRVRVELPGESFVGDAVDVTRDGHLLVVDDCPDRPREITAGDVIHVRPTG